MNIQNEFADISDVPLTGDPLKTIPVFQASSHLPYGFYVGDETGWSHWNGKEERVRRIDEDGTIKELPKYGIKDRNGNIIEPPVEGSNRLTGDMLMIIRVPNLASPGGIHTIIGGMHGYSIEAFFANIAENIGELKKVVGNTSFYQLLVPVRINSEGAANIDWNGWANWHPKFAPLRNEDF